MLIKKNSIWSWKFSVAALLIGVAAVTSLRTVPSKDIDSTRRIAPLKQNSAAKQSNQTAVNIGSFKKQVGEAELTKRIAKLESSLKSLHSQLAIHEMHAASNQEIDLMDDVNMDPAAVERAQTDTLVSFLDQQMRGEGVDVAWSERTKVKIAEVFTDNVFVDTVDCYRTLCRISADHANQDAEQNFLTQLISLEAFRDTDAFVERHEHDDGSVSNQIFIARGGYRLPDPAMP